MSIERRRGPRVAMTADGVIWVELRRRVRLLDISLTGALLACDTPFPVGTQGRLRVALSSAPVSVELEICREQGAVRKTGETSLGAMFASMDQASRGSLQQFLRRANQ